MQISRKPWLHGYAREHASITYTLLSLKLKIAMMTMLRIILYVRHVSSKLSYID
jgi:hypothetical protein